MGKMGLLMLAVGLGVAVYAYKKNKQKTHALPAAGVAAAGASFAASHSSQSSAASAPPPSSRPKLRDAEAIFTHLVKAVRQRELESFYPPSKSYSELHGLADHIAQTGTLEILADGWELPDAFALDLVQLALYDLVILADDSGSMNGGNNLKEMMTIVEDVADVGGAFDTNGIEIRFLNSKDQGNNVHNEQEIIALFQRNPPHGRTPIGVALRDKILQPLVVSKARQRALKKPVLVMILTDGAATDAYNDAVPRVILDAVKELKKITGKEHPPVYFSFGQVGTDREAVDWLDSIDNDRSIGAYVDVTSAPAIETAQVMKAMDKNLKNAPPEWNQAKADLKNNNSQVWTTIFRLKRMLGGIDSWYDASDEKGKKRWSFGSDAEYQPHWSEIPNREAQIKSDNKSRGYVWVQGGGSSQSSFRGPAASTGYDASYGQQQSYGQPQQQPYGQQSYGQPGFQHRDANSSPYPSQPAQPAGNFNSPYPPDNSFNAAPYPPAGSPYPPQQQNSPYPPPGDFNAFGGAQSGFGAPSNFGGPPQGSPYPPANNSPYPPAGGFSGGFNMPDPSNTYPRY